MANLQNNILIEVEQFIGEQLQDYTNEQVVRLTIAKFGISYREYAEALLVEYKDEISLRKSQSPSERVRIHNKNILDNLCIDYMNIRR